MMSLLQWTRKTTRKKGMLESGVALQRQALRGAQRSQPGAPHGEQRAGQHTKYVKCVCKILFCRNSTTHSTVDWDEFESRGHVFTLKPAVAITERTTWRVSKIPGFLQFMCTAVHVILSFWSHSLFFPFTTVFLKTSIPSCFGWCH